MRTIVWFREADLRVMDNPLLARAAALGGTCLPVYVLDTKWLYGKVTPFGNPKMGGRRARFIQEAIADLRISLQRLGSNLLVAVGDPADIIPSLFTKLDTHAAQGTTRNAPADSKAARETSTGGSEACVLIVSQEPCSEEQTQLDRVAAKLKRQAATSTTGRVVPIWHRTMYALDDLPKNCQPGPQLADSFTPWRKDVEKADTAIRRPLPRLKSLPPIWEEATAANLLAAFPVDKQSPGRVVLAASDSDPFTFLPDFVAVAQHGVNGLLSRVPTNDDAPQPSAFSEDSLTHDKRGVMSDTGSGYFQGGETAALNRLNDWMWGQDALRVYFETRNGMLGNSYSSKFSPYLAHGCISPRFIYAECKRYEQERIDNKSTYWLIFELMWRDYFQLQALKQGYKLFRVGGPIGNRSLAWAGTQKDFQKWVHGETGWPLVDANMRELRATGFMSNRGRQNVASFLVHELQCDWRWGADYFESMLLDYDCASNYGNWASVANLFGGRLNRFNIVKQTKDYDPKGDYIRTWVPELASLPPSRIAEPWSMSKSQMDSFGVKFGADYPDPMPSRFEEYRRYQTSRQYREHRDRGRGKQGKGNGKGKGKGRGNGREKERGGGRKGRGYEHGAVFQGERQEEEGTTTLSSTNPVKKEKKKQKHRQRVQHW